MDKQSYLPRKDSGIELDDKYEHTTGFLDLPPEVRTSIYELIFDPEESRRLAYHHPGQPDSLHEEYYASDHLKPLLTCRHIYSDAHLLAFSRTTFVVRNPFTSKDISKRLQSRLSQSQIQSVRSVSFVAEADHFRSMRNWKGHAFGNTELFLDHLDIVLHKSSYWHYMFDFNTIMVELLRNLKSVKRITYIKNGGRVKPHFHTWFNRLGAAILKFDELYRFVNGQPEERWWAWEFDGRAQTASLIARPAKPADLSHAEYEEYMRPIREDLTRSIEAEAYDPDPMSRNGYVVVLPSLSLTRT
ncbi:hypothetical protein AAFC00_006073 [Neodothiora populina]|uniref:Uncharacterized protein n=1 Tax=Neodothiora populina TaxID=2781224 RepID=A0ABR3P790_9PEZI